MSAHTPGPWHGKGKNGKWLRCDEWRIDNDDAGCTTAVPVHANKTVVAFIVTTGWGEDGVLDANARLIAAAPDLLAEVEREYAELSNVHNSWPGRDTPSGQMKLGRLRDLIAKATGRSEQDVQDDYGNRGTR